MTGYFAAALLFIGTLVASFTPAIAQDGPKDVTVILRPGQSQADVDAVLKAAELNGRSVTIRWEDTPVASIAPPSAAVGESEPSAYAIFESGLVKGAAGLAEVPGFIAQQVAISTSRPNHGIGASIIGLLAVAGLLTYGLQKLFRPQIIGAQSATGDAVSRLAEAGRYGGADLLTLVLFVALLKAGIVLVLRPDGLALEVANGLVRLCALMGVYWIVARLLLAPDAPSRRLLPLARSDWHRRLLIAYGIIGSIVGVIVLLAERAGGSPEVIEGLFLLGATILTLMKLYWFGAGRADFAALFTGKSNNPVRRIVAHLLPWLFIAIAIVIWVVGCMASVTPHAIHWGAAAGATQILVLILPIVALGAHDLLVAIAARATSVTPLRAAVFASARIFLTGGIWLMGLLAILRLWRSYLSAAGSVDALADFDIALRVGLAIVTGWALWGFLASYFAAYAQPSQPQIPGEEENHVETEASRLATVLPLLRDVGFGAVVAITVLVVLSSLDINIGPLLAGFGVIGLALSFGTQALVRDFVSGIFFIADDAFRVGEYIDTGKLKGTVEKISLRSLRLRHQNGQIHTLPFGQLQAITNFSRDWSTIKFELKFDPSTDPDLIRRAVKKVGLAMMEDEEIAPQLLLPLKMQGIQDVTETAMIVRLKFTAKPGNPTFIQREAMKRLLIALREAGLHLASNAVTVRSGPLEGAATMALPGKTVEEQA